MLDEIAANDHLLTERRCCRCSPNTALRFTPGIVTEIQTNGVRARKGHPVFIEADTVVAAFGMKPYDKTARAIYEKHHMNTRIIGDCAKIGKVGGAVRSGFFAALSLG